MRVVINSFRGSGGSRDLPYGRTFCLSPSHVCTSHCGQCHPKWRSRPTQPYVPPPRCSQHIEPGKYIIRLIAACVIFNSFIRQILWKSIVASACSKITNAVDFWMGRRSWRKFRLEDWLTGHREVGTGICIQDRRDSCVEWIDVVGFCSGHYMYRHFNIQQFYVLPTQCIYVFCVDLRTNIKYFPIQH